MYKVGDKVKIISLEKAKKWNRYEHDDVRFAPAMMAYCGQTTTIVRIRHWTSGNIGYQIDLEKYWNWIDDMFEPEQVESKEPEISFF